MIITVFPAASAGAAFHTGIESGKFHGVISATVPRGLRMVIILVSVSADGNVAGKIELATDAFNEWSSVPSPKRGEILLKAGEIMDYEKDAIARLMTDEGS